MKSAVDSSILDHLFSCIIEICIDDIFKVIVFAYLGPLRINNAILYQFFSVVSRKSCMLYIWTPSDALHWQHVIQQYLYQSHFVCSVFAKIHRLRRIKWHEFVIISMKETSNNHLYFPSGNNKKAKNETRNPLDFSWQIGKNYSKAKKEFSFL